MIVAPERDVPGISAKHWAKPTFNASRQVMSSTAATRAGRSLRSTQRITSAPAMNAAATGTAAKRCALMKLPKRSPSTAAGMKATTRFATNRCAARSDASPASTPRNFARYSQTIASIAPVWMAMSNVFAFSSLKPRRSPARIRWPVLETGRNSVRPSTTPRTRALRSSTVSSAAGILPGGSGVSPSPTWTGSAPGWRARRAKPTLRRPGCHNCAMNPWTRIDLYCERTDWSFWAEPLNALTNLAFLVAAILILRWTRDDRGRAPWDALLLAALAALVGVVLYFGFERGALALLPRDALGGSVLYLPALLGLAGLALVAWRRHRAHRLAAAAGIFFAAIAVRTLD